MECGGCVGWCDVGWGCYCVWCWVVVVFVDFDDVLCELGCVVDVGCVDCVWCDWCVVLGVDWCVGVWFGWGVYYCVVGFDDYIDCVVVLFVCLGLVCGCVYGY